MSQTVELPRVSGPGSGLGGEWRVIVRNDHHNTFDGVAAALARFIPGITLDMGHAIADRIHTTGLAIVW
ncbi:MAG: ATP-dependent Clp protease adaptor ClpS, partial [Solirubrobacteraceae bacterium]|nr:ATP-dependent Clp protease adaptor ClpS [Solirubrobacteraceae bacterium]